MEVNWIFYDTSPSLQTLDRFIIIYRKSGTFEELKVLESQ